MHGYVEKKGIHWSASAWRGEGRGTDYLIAQSGVVVLARDAEERADGASLDVEDADDVVRAARSEDTALEGEREADARELLQGDERGGGVPCEEVDREDTGGHAGGRAVSAIVSCASAALTYRWGRDA